MDILTAQHLLSWLQTIRSGLLSLWWFWLFIPLAYLAPELWLAYVKRCFRRSNPNRLIELIMPREVRKTPRAMEQVMTVIYSLRNNPGNYQEKWWDGEIPAIFSFEMASFGGEIHFYMWVPVRRVGTIRAALFSQYPDVEVLEVDDYTHRFPFDYAEVLEKGYRIFGNELLLRNSRKNNDVYPIRTYVDFEAVAEEKELDPISGVLEVLGSLKPQEDMWLQIVTRPLIDHSPFPPKDDPARWKQEGDEEISAIKERARFLRDASGKPVTDPETGLPMYTLPSPGETEAMKIIDRNMGKPGFHVVIRYMYFAPREIWSANIGQRALFAALNHYASESFSRFGHNVFAWTRANQWYPPYIFPQRRLFARCQRILFHYRNRKMYFDRPVELLLDFQPFNWKQSRFNMFRMNVEGLATLFHLPTFLVTTGPLMRVTEAKRVGAPAGLPIYGDGGVELPGTQKKS